MTEDKYFGFSIVIANFNSGKFLEDALLSVFSQNYPNYELIVMDGGSTDNSVEIIKKYEDKITYWQSKVDKGQSDAFNQGFAKATKEWLFWLNADDFMMPDSLFKLDKRMRRCIEKDGSLKWFCFDSLLVNKDGRLNRVINGPQYNNFFMKRLGPQIHSATSIFHKDLYYASQKFDEKLYWSMDLDLWYQFHMLGYKYKTIHCFAYCIRIHPESKTFSNGLKVERSEQRLQQSAYMVEKNKINIQRNLIKYWRFYKIFTIPIPRIYYYIKYKSKGSLIWWR